MQIPIKSSLRLSLFPWPYKWRSQEAREREHGAYMRTLAPDEIKHDNHFRAPTQSLLALDDAQPKTGKSRKKAYVMFLQQIRASLRLVADIFGDETETAEQNKLAA
jgi:hypothetical protein